MSLSTSDANNPGVVGDDDNRRPLHICITGSSSGIGLAAARTLVGRGHVVYHACRSLERAREAARRAGGGVPMKCDLSDLDSVREFAGAVLDGGGTGPPRLDVLCLNAGVAPFSGAKVPRLTRQGFEECIGVNHLGHFLLANLLYPKLRADGGGRLVVTASSVHDPEGPGGRSGRGGKGATLGDLSGLGVDLREIDPPNGGPAPPTMVDGSIEYDGSKCYKDSKLCNVLMCREAAGAFGGGGNPGRFPGIEAYSFTPGFVPTTGLFQPLRDAQWFRAHLLTVFAWASGISVPEQVGGDRLAYVATSVDLPQSCPNGSYLSAPGAKSRAASVQDGFTARPVSKEASDGELAAKLWDTSLEVVKNWMS